MANHDDEGSILGTALTTRNVEAIGRKVTATAQHLVGPLGEGTTSAYQSAMREIHHELRRPGLQRSVFSFVQNSPSEVVRARLSRTEIQHRALTYIPDELLESIPEDKNGYSLFQGFQASLPESEESEHRKKHRRHHSKAAKLLDDVKEEGHPTLVKLKRERDKASHKLEMMGIRKNLCSSEILEIDGKIANLNSMRKIVLDRLSDLEDDELKVEQELLELDNKVEDMQDLVEEEKRVADLKTPPAESDAGTEDQGIATPTGSTNFMSQSIYEKLPSVTSPKQRRGRTPRRRSMPIRHEHFSPGTSLREIPAHNDMITALDFDAPFGTMVTAALDDTVRVWDLNQGRCLGLLEGHRASVRCLQVEENIVATGSIDADVRLWDLSKARYPFPASSSITSKPTSTDEGEPSEFDPLENDDAVEAPQGSPSQPPPASMADTLQTTLSAHVSEITALHFHKDTLVSGSADKTLRQWDLVNGRCVQTLDVLWAAAQAQQASSSSLNTNGSGGGGGGGGGDGSNSGSGSGPWRSTSRLPDASADFVGALQCFDAALACGTADGMVRLWDLRTGQVHRSLVGHTGAVTALQFDDVHLVTGSADRSVR
ncbi:MAG: hypothetical protein LQ340_003085, partial [Diploschistes diacapsis]